MPIDRLALKDRRKAPIYRSWWTRERVRAGLLRLYADTGHAPNCGDAPYRRLMRELGQHGLKGALRRYPTDASVLRYWPSMAAAWRELGITPDGRRGLATLPDGSGADGGAWRYQVGERHGRLVVVEFAGYYTWAKGRKGLWLCRCDCGKERIVEAGNFKVKRECRSCAHRRGRALSLARQAAQRAAGVSSSSLAGAGAPRATSPG